MPKRIFNLGTVWR